MQPALLRATLPSHVWRGREHNKSNSTGYVPSGFLKIDDKIHGWPLGTLIEIVPHQIGIGEFSILLPALAQLSQDSRWILLVCPPYTPYAPFLSNMGVDTSKVIVTHAETITDAGWCMEQGLRSHACSAVIGWFPQITEKIIRRLQLTLEEKNILGIFFTKPSEKYKNNPTPWRFILKQKNHEMLVEIPKRRGGGPINPISIPNPSQQTCCGFV